MKFIARLLRLFDAPYCDDSLMMLATNPDWAHRYRCEDFDRDGYCDHTYLGERAFDF